MNRRRWLVPVAAALGAAVFALASASPGAEQYPTKPIRVIVTLGAGGAHDLHARAVASIIPEYLGQPMVVQLMPGAGGKIGMLALKRAKPDGYTLVMGSSSQMTIGPHARDMGYDPMKDFIPIFQVNYADYMLMSRTDKPWKTFEELVEAARKSPGKVSYGSSGVYGTGHLMILKIQADTKIKLNHIPFTGGGPAMQAMLGGHVDLAGGLPATGGAIDHVRAGVIRALAVSSEKRTPLLPDVPTLREKGVDFLLPSWRTLLAPAGTPQERIDILVEALKKVVKDKTFVSLLQKMGERPVPLYGPALLKQMREEYERYGAVFRSIGLEKKK